METKTKQTSQPWDPHILSYGWCKQSYGRWKHKNQTISILLNIQVIHHHYCCSFLISFFLLFVFQVLFFWVCSSCSRFMWIERETNTTFWFGFSCIFGLFFVLGGERHKFEQKYLFIPNFNKVGLRKTNRT